MKKVINNFCINFSNETAKNNIVNACRALDYKYDVINSDEPVVLIEGEFTLNDINALFNKIEEEENK